MKTIRLTSLTMIGFRGERERTTTFSPNETIIAGPNGSGKSRHLDAFLWCLFGKDRNGRKDEDVKSYDEAGNTTDKAPCEVSLTLSVDGEPLTLRRAYVEEWVKPRGQAEEVFRGHHTDCYWDDVPVSVTEFGKRLSALIDETTFKLLTNPEYFASLKWEDQRAILFDVAHTPSIEEIAASSPEWEGLVDKLNGKSLADFRRRIAARKKKLKEDAAKIQPKIDQTRILLPQWQDRKTLEPELAGIEAELTDIDKAIASSSERLRKQDKEASEREAKIQELRSKQRQLIAEEHKRADEETYQRGAHRRELQHKIDETKRRLEECKSKSSSFLTQYHELSDLALSLKAQMLVKREEWMTLHATIYNGETTCPHCHQQLPDEQIAKAEAVWQSEKKARLDAIAQEGTLLKERSAKCEEDLIGGKAIILQNEDEATLLNEILIKQQADLLDLPEEEAVKPTPAEQLPGYNELEEQIQELLKQADNATIETDSTEAYTAKRKKLSDRRDEIKKRLASQDQWDDYTNRIKILEDEAKAIAQQIADAEKEEYEATRLALHQVEECERVINSRFRGVTFRLFEYTIDDKNREFPSETCQPLVNGVPITAANTASRITAGLEIIRVLSEHHQVCAPVFVDNSESIQTLPDDLTSQIIRLQVSDDKELNVTHIN
nr:MAG TPA: chromosome partition protein [Caudoviricetes sp.]